MANFTFNCPQCNQSLEAQDEWRGQQTQCPSCGNNIEIPKIMLVKPVIINPQEQLKNSKIGVYFFGGLTILLCFICVALICFTGIPMLTIIFVFPVFLGILMTMALYKKIQDLKSQIDQNKHLK